MRAARETGSTSSTRSSAPRSSETAPSNARRDARLDAADDARAAAVGDDRDVRVRRPLEHAPRTSASSRGRATTSGDVLEAPAEARGRCRRRTCRRLWQARSRSSVEQIAPARRGPRRAAPAARGVGSGLLDARSSRSRAARRAGRRRARLAGADDCVLEAPAPAVACARHAAAILPSATAHARRARHPRPRPVAPRRGRGPLARRATSTPPPARAEAADAAIAALRDRGSPSHDGLAARLVGHERARRAARAATCSRCAGRCASSRATRRCSVAALCVTRDGRRPLAGRAPRAVAVVLGRALGARRRRRGRRRREPGRHAHARARRGVVGRARARPRSRRSCGCRTGW